MRAFVILFCLGAAIALPNPVNLASAPINVNDPSAADPTVSPTSISFPIPVDYPIPDGIPEMPDGCDSQNPSDDCFNAMKAKNNYIYFETDSGCSDEKKSQIATAIWDATTLANYASTFPSGTQNRDQASGLFWLGPNWASVQSRVAGNLGRIGKWKATSDGEYITVSCKDTQNRCGENYGKGQNVGGYAWTYSGWLAYYHYINLCPPFFTLETLNDKIEDVENDLASGSTRYAIDMTWLRTTGQYFLHEMMHLRIADGGEEPHIGDRTVGTAAAYGPKKVHALAVEDIYAGGGAQTASVNADSYAMLANSIWWWDTTGYFPGIPAKATDEAPDDFPICLFVDLYDAIEPSVADWDQIYAPQLQMFENDDTDTPTTTIYVTPIPAVPTPTA